MKFIPIALLLILLASCTHNHDHDHDEGTSEVQAEDFITLPDDEFLDEISDELEDIDQSESTDEVSLSSQNQVVEVDAGYNHPGGRSDMIVTMEIQDGIIQSIEATSPQGVRRGFNDALQNLIGNPVSEAEDFYAAGSSLASEAFNNAVKSL